MAVSSSEQSKKASSKGSKGRMGRPYLLTAVRILRRRLEAPMPDAAWLQDTL